jgi:hypothetical protein
MLIECWSGFDKRTRVGRVPMLGDRRRPRPEARLFLSGLLGVLAIVAAGCGSSPTSPSPSIGGSGALIQGAVVGASSGTAGTSALRSTTAVIEATTPAGLMVTVEGTSIGSAVGPGGTFVLENVPGGNVVLLFTGPGVNARVTLADVQGSETIAITVSVQGDSVAVESERRSLGNETQLEGRIESVPPTTPPGTLVVAGQTVTTDGNTRVLMGSSTLTLTDLVVGLRVHLKGTASGSALLASVIQIQNTNVDLPVNINGEVEGLTGTPSDFRFSVNGRAVRGDANTDFFGGSEYDDVADGVRVEIKGLQRDGYVYASRLHVNVDDDDDGEQDESASIEGPLTAMAGSGTTLSLTIDGTTVTTNGQTEVRRRGDVQTLSVLQLGMIIHVVGTRQSDGSLHARMLQIKDDAPGGSLEIEGAAGGVKGTCPSLQFSVNGYAISTNSATVFTPGCGTLKSGAHVTVVGLVQAGGGVLATSVTAD